MVKAVVFDLRDTLVKVERAYGAAGAYFLEFLRENGSPLTEEEFKTLFGEAMSVVKKREGRSPSVHNWTALFARELFRKLNLDLDEAKIEAFLDHYDQIFIDNTELYRDAQEVLDFLRSREIQMAVVIDGTSKRERAILAKHELDNYFNVRIISEEVGRNKFTSVPLEAAVQRLNLPVSEILVVGDRIDKDIIHANKLGCLSVKLERTGGRYTEQQSTDASERPFYTIRSLDELMGLVS